MSSRVGRRTLIRTALAASAGVSGVAAAAAIMSRYGLIPPDHGGLYGAGETITYSIADDTGAFEILGSELRVKDLGGVLTHEVTAEKTGFSKAVVPNIGLVVN